MVDWCSFMVLAGIGRGWGLSELGWVLSHPWSCGVGGGWYIFHVVAGVAGIVGDLGQEDVQEGESIVFT